MKTPDLAGLVAGILRGDFVKLAQAITIVESDNPDHWPLSRHLLEKLHSHQRPALRLGISGPPGVGKSTFIEAFGNELIKAGKLIAVLAVDPSSQLTGGSILGDKTRMEKLAREKRAFVRPSPSRGQLGGVTASMPAILNLCEAAGFDWIIIETVGVGQSEAEVRLMVDKFLLLAQPGAGDDLQGIKKGILEYVDLIVVNKTDLDERAANLAKTHLLMAVKVLRGRDVPVRKVSAITHEGIGELVTELLQWRPDLETRKNYQLRWFESLLVNRFQALLQSGPRLSKKFHDLCREIENEGKLPTQAVEEFFADA